MCESTCETVASFCFFCPSSLPFGGSTVLSLTRGPAGNQTTTAGLSATSRMPRYQLPTRTTKLLRVFVFEHELAVDSPSCGSSRLLIDFFSVQRLHGFRQVVTHIQSRQTVELQFTCRAVNLSKATKVPVV